MTNNHRYPTECHNLTMFGEWLDEELKSRGLSQYALGKSIGVTPTHINHIIHGRRKPSAEMLKAIAGGLKLPVQFVYRQAGILSQESEMTATRERLNYLFDKFPDSEKEELLTYMELKLEILKKQGKIKID